MITKTGSVKLDNKEPLGSVVLIIKFWPSTVMDSILTALAERALCFIVYSMDSFTFWGVIGVPLWNLTFSRMWNFHVVGSTFSQESANCGANFISGVTTAKVSPAPIRVNVHASHSWVGSNVSPNQYKPTFICFPCLLSLAVSLPHPTKRATMHSMDKHANNQRFIISPLKYIASSRLSK